MSQSGEEFHKVAVLPADDGLQKTSGRNALSTQVRLAERALTRYFAVSRVREDVTHSIIVTPDDPLYTAVMSYEIEQGADLSDLISQYPVLEVDLGQQAGLNEMIHQWLGEAEKTDPRAAFKSMYKVLSVIESAEDGEGALSIEQHSRILKSAAATAVSSSMIPEEKFIALAGLLRFVGPPQNHIIDTVISPAMRQQMKEMESQCLCALSVVAFLSHSWEVADETHEEDEPVIIDGVAVIVDTEADPVADFKAARMGIPQNRNIVRNMIADEIIAHPENLIPLFEDQGREGVRSLLLSIEETGRIKEQEVDRLAHLIEAKGVALLPDKTSDPGAEI